MNDWRGSPGSNHAQDREAGKTSLHLSDEDRARAETLESEDALNRLEQSIDKWPNAGGRCEDQEQPKEQQDRDHGNQPP